MKVHKSQTQRNSIMTIYKSYEMDRFYRDYNMRMPMNILQYDKMLVCPATLNIQPLVSRFFKAGNITVMYGRANCGKTPLHFSLATALSTGCNLDNVHTVCSEPQSCLIVSGEMNDAQWAKIMGWNKKTYSMKNGTAFVEIANYRWKLDTTEGQQHFEDLVRRVNADHKWQRPVSVLIFDSIKTLTSAGDSSSKWNVFFSFLNKLREQHGWTIIVIHHTHKGKDDDSFGTYDIDVKVDNKIYIGKDFAKACNKLEGIERWLPPEDDKQATKDYFAFVKGKTDEMLRGRYADSIWFYLTLEKGRDFRASEKLPVLMRMLPEDEHPRWDVVDILPDESDWSFRTFSTLPKEASNSLEDKAEMSNCPNANADSDADSEEKKPTYEELLKSRNRELVQKWLRKGYAEGHTTRQKLAEWLGCKKTAIDNLMNNKHYDSIKEEDLKG